MAAIPDDIYKPDSQNRNSDFAVLVITDNKVEDLEFFYPYYRFLEAGFKVDVATLNGGGFEGKHGIGLKDGLKLEHVNPDNYQLLYLPGGKAPEKLKKDKRVLEIARYFAENDKPVAALCYGPQILAAANVIRGHDIAAWPEVQNEVEKAGGLYVNREAEIDRPFVTARWPGDLPMHLKKVFEFLKRREDEQLSLSDVA